MKKATALLLAAMMTFSLTACGSKEENAGNSGSSSNKEQKTEESKSAEKEINPEDLMGSWEENVYKNEFAGITYTLPEGWTRQTDEEIKATMNLGSDIVYGDSEYKKALVEQSTISGMMAQNGTTGDSVLVNFENLKKSGGVNLTEEEYFSAIKTQLTQIKEIDYVLGEARETVIGGETYQTMPVTIAGTNASQDYNIRKIGDYILAVTVTSMNGDTASLMGAFQ